MGVEIKELESLITPSPNEVSLVIDPLEKLNAYATIVDGFKMRLHIKETFLIIKL